MEEIKIDNEQKAENPQSVISHAETFDYCFSCGIPLTTAMVEDTDWFEINNNGERFPLCKDCYYSREEKTSLTPILKQQTRYISKYDRVIPGFYRRNAGTYNKKFASICRKVLHFVFSFTPFNIELTFRGRGSRKNAASKDNKYARSYDQDLPIRHAKRVAVYLSIVRKGK